MNTGLILHRMAMECYDLARIYRAKGQGQRVFDEYREKSWILSRQAALQMLTEPDDTHFKYMVIASGAKVAYDTGRYEESKKIIELGLAGNPEAAYEHEMNRILGLIAKEYKTKKTKDKAFTMSGILTNADIESNHIKIREDGKKQLHSIAMTTGMLRDFVGFYLGKWVTIQLDKDASGSFHLTDIRLAA